MIFQSQIPAGVGILFLLPFSLVIGLFIALIYLIRKNKNMKKQIAMFQERR